MNCRKELLTAVVDRVRGYEHKMHKQLSPMDSDMDDLTPCHTCGKMPDGMCL